MPTALPTPHAVGSPLTRGDRDDRCPGSIRLYDAADGSVARIRVAGRPLTSSQIIAIASVATDLGNRVVELTSRSNLQVRGLSPEDGPLVAARLHACGLLPSETHERVRNVVAAPFGGPEVDAVAAALDDALCAEPLLSGLSGRFLFAVVGGDDAGETQDVGDVPADVVLGSLADVPPALRVARAFLEVAARAQVRPWQVAELDQEGLAQLRDLAGATAYGLVGRARRAPGGQAAAGTRLPGVLRLRDEVFVSALAPLGRVSADALGALGEVVGSRGARVSPWRTVVLPGLSDDAAATALSTLAAAGWVTSADDALVGHTACTGLPGCARAQSDVQADALRLAPSAAVRPPTGALVHWSGCERRCGHPSTAFVDRLAVGPRAYAVDGDRVAVGS